MARRVVIGALLALALIVGAVGVVYAFGTPTSVPEQTDVASLEQPPAPDPAVDVAEKDPVSSSEAPPPDPQSPLAIQIPGCVCHSDDPKLVKEHESYRMNQCAGCHAGGVPTGEK